MAGLNQASLIGRIGNFLELKGKEGKEVVNFSVATENAMDKKADPEQHMLVAFGKTAINITKHLKKDSQIYVTGRLQTRSYMKDDVKHNITEIVVENIQFL